MVRVHLVDATYELFRAFFGAPARAAPDGREVGAVRGLLGSMLFLLQEEGATHVGCAADTVIESFRNQLYPGYKTGEGVDPKLMAQFPLAEEALRALGLVVWGMVEFEADDALATAAHRFAADPAVEQVVVATPDKDLAQVVRGERVVLLDRRQKKAYDEAGVRAKWGVGPESIADWLALVGDSADGYPGIPGWGEKSASAVLAVYRRLEDIPDDARAWKATVRGAERLAGALATRRAEAALYKRLATLRLDAPVGETLAEMEWRGARPELRALCERLGFNELSGRVRRWREG
jgi:5'-3' exonuclease